VEYAGEPRHHYRYEKDPSHRLERCHEPNEWIQRHDAAIAHPAQGDHAEVEKVGSVRRRKAGPEGIGNRFVQQPEELRERNRKDQIGVNAGLKSPKSAD
jgi:hypothetical protein